MRINLTEYRPASTSVLGPIGGSTVAPAESATGQTLNDIKNQRDQQIMDMITGGLDATALVLEANKKIKAGEDEIRLLNAEEKAKSKSSNVYDSAFKNESISVGSDADEYTYSVDPALGTLDLIVAPAPTPPIAPPTNDSNTICCLFLLR